MPIESTGKTALEMVDLGVKAGWKWNSTQQSTEGGKRGQRQGAILRLKTWYDGCI